MAEPSFQVDSFEQRLKAEKADVGLQKSENSSLAEFAAEIQRDGDQVLHVHAWPQLIKCLLQFLRVLNKAQIDEGSFRDLIKVARFGLSLICLKSFVQGVKCSGNPCCSKTTRPHTSGTSIKRSIDDASSWS